FGVFKRRFGLVKAAPEYDPEMQAMSVGALGGVHNYVRIHDPSDNIESWTNNAETRASGSASNRTPQEPRRIAEEQLGINITAEERQQASDRRDHMAQEMWKDYQEELRRRGDIN
ncbi:hypothetical protein B0H34DRAFT_664634, partial [Crassisporium funariophilum]